MSALRIARSGPLRGRLRLPGDLHVGQQAILWAALADSPSLVSGLSGGREHELLVLALRALGVPIAATPAGLRIAGAGLHGLKLPPGALSAGDSPTTLELLTALLSGQAFGTRIEAQGRALAHSLRTVVEPLRARGAHLRGRSTDEGDVLAPVAAAPRLPGELLSEVEIAIPYGDPATKLALLVSGLYARGITAISEAALSRDHAERALVALGVPVETMGGMTLLDTSERVPSWPGFTWTVPGDATLFAYTSAAVLAVPGSDVTFEGVLVNRSRSAWLEVLTQAGARVDVLPQGDVAGNEPVADVRVRATRLRSARLGGEQCFRLLDEGCALLALAPALGARLSLRDAAALRARSGDPVRRSAQLARLLGVDCTDYDDGFDVSPSPALTARAVEAELPEVALLALVLGLSAEGTTELRDAGLVDALYPGWIDALVQLGASVSRSEE